MPDTTGRVRVFIATSLDGFIAGDGDDLSWLPPPPDDGSDFGYGAFMAQIGALLMGRRTYDVVTGFDVPWPYGERPVLVWTREGLESNIPGVRPVHGTIAEAVWEALDAANGADVYVDGGVTIRHALDAGLIDELIVTLIPVVLGHGVPLFAGTALRHNLSLVSAEPLPGGLVQLTYVPVRAEDSA